MKMTRVLAIVLATTLLSLGEAGAQTECSILYYPWFEAYPLYLDRTRLTSLGYDVTGAMEPADLSLENLQQHDVLLVFLVGLGLIADYQDDIADFVAAGGALYIHQPNAVGTVDYAPPGFAVEITFVAPYTCGVENCLTDTTHPITAGLADVDLTGTHDQVGAIGAGYTDILAESCVCMTPSLAVGAYGDGVVAFDVGNLAFGTPTSDAYVHQLLGYLCEAGTVATEAATWGRLKALFE